MIEITFFSSQILSLLPLYLLELCYGMNSGFTAILTPQLYGQCAEFHISLDQLSWIGEFSKFYQMACSWGTAYNILIIWRAEKNLTISVPELVQINPCFLFPLKTLDNNKLVLLQIFLFTFLIEKRCVSTCLAVQKLISFYLYF